MSICLNCTVECHTCRQILSHATSVTWVNVTTGISFIRQRVHRHETINRSAAFRVSSQTSSSLCLFCFKHLRNNEKASLEQPVTLRKFSFPLFSLLFFLFGFNPIQSPRFPLLMSFPICSERKCRLLVYQQVKRHHLIKISRIIRIEGLIIVCVAVGIVGQI